MSGAAPSYVQPLSIVQGTLGPSPAASAFAATRADEDQVLERLATLTGEVGSWRAAVACFGSGA